MLNYSSDPTIFDNLDWNGKIISWAEPQAGSKYQDGVLYLYQDGAMHEIGPQGEGDDAPILNADFYAEDFKPQNGRFYRQVGTSKKIGPIEHEQGSRNLTLYFDMSMPIEDMVYALEGLERDEIPPMSETGGLKMWAMVGDRDGGGLNSISILHVPANTEGMACDKDFWQIGIFGGLISLWNSETYQMQIEHGGQAQTVAKGWHESMSGQTLIVDGKMVMSGADYYVFNTQYWNAFTSTEPIKEAAKNTIARYHDGVYDDVALKSNIPTFTVDTQIDQSSNNPIANSAVANAINNIPTIQKHYVEEWKSGYFTKLMKFLLWVTYRQFDNKVRRIAQITFNCSGSITFDYPDGSTVYASDFYLYTAPIAYYSNGNNYQYVFEAIYPATNSSGTLLTPFYVFIIGSENNCQAYISKSLTLQPDYSGALEVTGFSAYYESSDVFDENN